MAALYYYPLFELSDKTSDAQAVIFTCLLNNNSSNVFLNGKYCQIKCVPLPARACSLLSAWRLWLRASYPYIQRGDLAQVGDRR